MFPILAGNSASTGYNLTRSLRFRASASAYLNRTFASAGNRKTFTLSTWVKRGALGTRQSIFDAYAASAGNSLEFQTSDILEFYAWGGASVFDLATTQVFRDPSAWYHIVVAVDTTQATAANRIKLYINGTQVTAFGTATYPAQNTDLYINNNIVHNIGRRGDAQFYFDGYQTEDNFVDGQALTPSSFGSTNATTGVWQPARYTGTYGTNGFYLPFTDNSALTTSSNVGLGKDFSGNGNYWTTNNISITAGVTYDSMTDVPTLTSATAANFCTLNPLDKQTLYSTTIADGNLSFTTNNDGVGSTIQMTSGKWYWESTFVSNTSSSLGAIGIVQGSTVTNNPFSTGVGYYANNGNKYVSGAATSYGSSWTVGDVIGIALDVDGGTVTFYKNNTSQGSISLPTTTSGWKTGFGVGTAGTCTFAYNFGQRPFTYTPPTGFVSLNTYNLPTSTILAGNKVMDATLYTGSASAINVVNGGSFKPDFVWVKTRSAVTSHELYDSVRGAGNRLSSDSTGAQSALGANGLTSFNSNGFTVPSTSNYGINSSGYTFVGWNWQAGQGSTSSNTSGTITSTVSVNASAGFSIVNWNGNSTYNATIGHGLGVAPQLIIVKDINAAAGWPVYHVSLTNSNWNLYLQATGAQSNDSQFGSTPTSSVIYLGGSGSVTNVSGHTYVAYCWTPIAGYSAFSSFVGNGSTDGVFVYTGFQPRWLMIKRTDSADDWVLLDTARNPYNVMGNELYPNLSSAEGTGYSSIDTLSNGFKLRSTGSRFNASGGTYIYAAFATSPFKNSLAR